MTNTKKINVQRTDSMLLEINQDLILLMNENHNLRKYRNIEAAQDSFPGIRNDTSRYGIAML